MGKKKGGGVRIKQVGPKQPAMPPMNPFAEAMQIRPEDMVQLPPPPNRSYQIFWPIRESLTMKTDGFQVLYPSYMDSDKTVKQGRRVSKENAIPCPTVNDMSQALQQLEVRHVVQPYKGYSRDITCLWDNPGRLLVDVSAHPKKELLRELPKRMADLPGRNSRIAQEAANKIEEEKAAAERRAAAQAAAKASAPKPKAAGNKKKAGGKKGKRK